MRTGQGHVLPAFAGGGMRWSSMIRRTNSTSTPCSSASAHIVAPNRGSRSKRFVELARAGCCERLRQKLARIGATKLERLEGVDHPDHVAHFVGMQHGDDLGRAAKLLARTLVVAYQDPGLCLERQHHAEHRPRHLQLLGMAPRASGVKQRRIAFAPARGRGVP